MAHPVDAPLVGHEIPGAGGESLEVEAGLRDDLGGGAVAVDALGPAGGADAGHGLEGQPLVEGEGTVDAEIGVEAGGRPGAARQRRRREVGEGQVGRWPFGEVAEAHEAATVPLAAVDRLLRQVEAELGELLDDILVVVRLGGERGGKIAAGVGRGDFEVRLRITGLADQVRAEVAHEPGVRLAEDIASELDAVDAASVDFAEQEGALAIRGATVDVGEQASAVADVAALELALPDDAALRLFRVVVAEGRPDEDARLTVDIEQAADPEGRGLAHQERGAQVTPLAFFAAGVQVKVVRDVAIAVLCVIREVEERDAGHVRGDAAERESVVGFRIGRLGDFQVHPELLRFAVPHA